MKQRGGVARVSGPCGIFSPALFISFLEKEADSLISLFLNDVQPSFQSTLPGTSIRVFFFRAQQVGSVRTRQVLASTTLLVEKLRVGMMIKA